MRIEYETTLPDLQEWQRFYANQPFVRRYLWDQRCIKAVLCAGTAFFLLFFATRDFWQAFLTACATFMVGVLAFFLVERRQSHLLLQKRISVAPAMAGIGRRCLEITDETVSEGADQITVTVHWPLVVRIACGPRHLFFILRNHSAMIVPLDAITPTADRERFLDFLRRCAPPELRKEIPEAAPSESAPGHDTDGLTQAIRNGS